MWQQADMGSRHWALKSITEPTEEPITLDEAKQHLRVDIDDDDTYIMGLIIAARMIAEERTNRALITQTWDMIIDDFPMGDTIKLRKPCLQSVESVNYTDSSGIEHIMPDTDYVVDTNSVPGRVFLGFAKIWPVVVLQPAASVRIRFTAGYGDTADAVPQGLKNAMLLLIGNWYANREIVEVKNRYAVEIPKTFDILFGPYKVPDLS
jgi:uncharacterized phiE125 gp8 family phage protein